MRSLRDFNTSVARALNDIRYASQELIDVDEDADLTGRLSRAATMIANVQAEALRRLNRRTNTARKR